MENQMRAVFSTANEEMSEKCAHYGATTARTGPKDSQQECQMRDPKHRSLRTLYRMWLAQRGVIWTK